MNWGSVSVDPNNHLMFVNDMRLGLANYMVPRANVAKKRQRHRDGDCANGRYAVWRNARTFPVAVGYSVPETAIRYDVGGGSLHRQQLVWQVPVGTVQDTGPLGIRMHMPIPIGMPTLGASLSTQSGLLFFAGTQDFYLRV